MLCGADRKRGCGGRDGHSDHEREIWGLVDNLPLQPHTSSAKIVAMSDLEKLWRNERTAGSRFRKNIPNIIEFLKYTMNGNREIGVNRMKLCGGGTVRPKCNSEMEGRLLSVSSVRRRRRGRAFGKGPYLSEKVRSKFDFGITTGGRVDVGVGSATSPGFP